MENYPVRCKTCKKTAKNCRCFIYRLERTDPSPLFGIGKVYVDNVATEPVRGESVGTWQPRRNARIWRRPQFVDEYGPICYTLSEEAFKKVEEAINNETFYLDDFSTTPDVRVRDFDRAEKRRLPFLRRGRRKKSEAV